MEASTNIKPSLKRKREGKETVVKAARSAPALDDTLDMDELFETVIGAAPAVVTKFTLGSLADRILEVRDGMIQLYSLSKPFQCVGFTTNRWANFMTYFNQLDDDAKEINKKTRDVNTLLHIGDSYHISIKSAYSCVDFRLFYVPYGLTYRDCRPGRLGIALRLEEWSDLKMKIDAIHAGHPEFANATSCTTNTDHQTTEGWKKCTSCYPWGVTDIEHACFGLA